MKLVYLAGPDVFRPDAVALGEFKKKACSEFGFQGLFPFDNELPPGSHDVSTSIYKANVAMIARADFAIFNLTPFRGPSADVGTVFELGMTIAAGKPAFAYSNQNGDLISRLRVNPGLQFDEKSNTWRDPDLMAAEDFGNADNLMIDASLAMQGRVIHQCGVDAHARYTDMRGFFDCLREARAFFESEEVCAA